MCVLCCSDTRFEISQPREHKTAIQVSLALLSDLYIHFICTALFSSTRGSDQYGVKPKLDGRKIFQTSSSAMSVRFNSSNIRGYALGNN